MRQRESEEKAEMVTLVRERRPGGPVLMQNCAAVGRGEEQLEYLTFPLLEGTGMVRHLFSTRLGGVSRGEFSSMNLSFTRGDDENCVRENYRAAVWFCLLFFARRLFQPILSQLQGAGRLAFRAL